MNNLVAAFKENANISETFNGAKTYKSSLNKCLDLFFIIGSSRNKDIIPVFSSAFMENPDVAIRILLWSRDIRGGAGERQTFRNLLKHLSIINPEIINYLIPIIPEIGRWDDLFVVINDSNREEIFSFIESNLDNPAVSGLIKKWLPRPKSSPLANDFRKFLNMTPKQYRKMLVEGSDTVEQKITAKAYEKIDYSKVPSVASAKYSRHFSQRDAERYVQYLQDVKSGKKDVKINASAIFPHDIIKGWRRTGTVESLRMDEQWKAIPFDMGEKNILPVIDVSGSMGVNVSGTTTALDISLALGVLSAMKNNGAFKDFFVSFSQNPKLHNIDSNLPIVDILKTVESSDWGMNTDIDKVFELIIELALDNDVDPCDMPTHILILSDMEFDYCGKFTAFEQMKLRFSNAGYELPQIIFWNLNARAGNVPVKFNDKGVALLSGYSPAIMKAVLEGDDSMLDPVQIMLNSVGSERYQWI